ncbi:peptidyl-prolyl cis-trans isomerase CYP21-4-like isoform X1 [Durio zibethinus]|uniref:Peptidyl-prolyl cis-trans isomerase n=1 Tax=Durio zibethinus TaxID=66656 RepID=A0A6P5ZZC1_DURZI|nr:peptidyl-prolyl cis-trans isomerase CYP21-4-like isoform X1 [Durio zibethinus]XP_022757855.1 peptidyl-prolyl cis-trans isomerase CYP21-4-like isoform X1 [Durio zibethinus]XP_022757856.1 peptidyl-prolyl cis-trans isomerase CYP21-4-like isoform X1 [Durio zibethinus]
MARIKPQALLQQSKKKRGPARISVTTIILSSLIVVLTVFFLYATYRHWSQRSRIQIENNKQSIFEGDGSFIDSKKSDLPGYAILDTAKGSITVEFFKDSSPEAVDQFLDLCQRGHFNGMLFRHVIKHYVIEAGSSDKLGAAEDWTLKGKHYGQLDTSLKHEAFMLGTSKAKHDDRGFELFITTAPIPDLNEKLIVFGKVIKGQDVVQEIEEVDTDEHYRPKSSIKIHRVTLKQSI